MTARHMVALFRLVRELPNDILCAIATVPKTLFQDYMDTVIVFSVQAELARRAK